LRDYPVAVAPPDQQKCIVAEIEKQFSRLDEAVANLKRVKANLKRYKASVLKSAVEGKLTEDWRKQHSNVEPASKLLERILAERRAKRNGRGEYKEPAVPEGSNLTLPKKWIWATVDQLSVVVRGASPRPAGDPRYFGGTIPWITVGPITADQKPYLTSVPETVTEAGRERSRYLEPHTLLLTNSGATLGVPKITLIGGCINDGVAALLDVVYPLKLYLLYFLHTQTTRLRRVNQGAAQPNLNTSIIKAINVPLPPHNEQEQIVAEVERRLSVIEELEAAVQANLTRADRLRQSVLQQAFEGRLARTCV
jgi:type I restriction enzyme S subunit